jgi:hypothetical protein
MISYRDTGMNSNMISKLGLGILNSINTLNVLNLNMGLVFTLT